MSWLLNWRKVLLHCCLPKKGKMAKDRFITIHPRDWVNGPFKDCPQCKKSEFGVLSIFESSYVRRCRECLYSEQFSLPLLKKTIIYLDQFAISEMMKALDPSFPRHAEVDSFWKRLFEKLDRLSKLQLVVCPGSDTHYKESRLYQYSTQVQRVLDQLSHAIRFEDFQWMIKWQVHECLEQWIRGDEIYRPSYERHRALRRAIHGWQDRLIFTANSKWSPEFLEEVKADREKVYLALTEVFKMWQSGGKTFDEWLENEKSNYGKAIWEAHLRHLLNVRDILEGKKKAGDFLELLPGDASQIISMVQEDLLGHKVPQAEVMQKTWKFLTSPMLTQIPYVQISSHLWASEARKAAGGKKHPPNQGTHDDFHTISTLVPYVDAIFIDSVCWSYLQEEPVKGFMTSFPAKIFSPRNRDQFMNYLDEIENSASKDHLKLVDEVYGDKWVQPFLGMFQDSSNSD